MLVVHHLRISQSERIVWLCEELGVPYELKLYNRLPSMMGPPEYRSLHPLGSAPTITDGPLTLAESGAVIEYIIHQYGDGRLIPKPGDAGWTDYLFWFHVGNGSVLPMLMRGMMMKFAGLAADNPVVEMGAKRSDAMLDMFENHLASNDYLAGAQFTAADIMNLFPFTRGQAFMPFDLSKRPAISRWVERNTARPAYQRAMTKAEPA